MVTYNRLRNDKRAQMFILEVLTTGLLIIATINFITTLPTPAESSTVHLHKWSTQGTDVLRAMDNMPSTNPLKYLSRLNQGICEDVSIITEKLNSSLSETLSFNIYLENLTGKIPLYSCGSPDISSTARADYITFLLEGYCTYKASADDSTHWTEIHAGIYQVSLVIWLEARG